MEIDDLKIQALVDRPSESLAVEIKSWIDLDEPNGMSKLVRAALALRNHGGGYLLIGFNDLTLKPEMQGFPENVRDAFHPEKIQMAVAKYASESFEVSVFFGLRDGKEFPVIVVPAGVRTPVASKADLFEAGKKLIATDDVYVRTLRSNVPATAKAGWKDWAALTQVCLDNREADIGRFLRRHMVGNIEGLKGVLSELDFSRNQSVPSERAMGLLDLAAERMSMISEERGDVMPKGGHWDASLVIDPPLDGYIANTSFLRKLDVANPRLTGWPIWLVSWGVSDEMQPFVNEDAWETYIGKGRHIQYMRFDPKGSFVQRMVLADDMSPSEVEPGKFLDFAFPVQDCAEAIAAGLEFFRAFFPEDKRDSVAPVHNLNFAFRWSGLKGREISNWGNPRRYVSHSGVAYQDSVASSVMVPADLPLSSIGTVLLPVIKRLYAVFSGFDLPDSVIEDIAYRTVNRRPF